MLATFVRYAILLLNSKSSCLSLYVRLFHWPGAISVIIIIWFMASIHRPCHSTYKPYHPPSYSVSLLQLASPLEHQQATAIHQYVFSGMYVGQLQGSSKVDVTIALFTQVVVSARELDHSSFDVVVILCSKPSLTFILIDSSCYTQARGGYGYIFQHTAGWKVGEMGTGEQGGTNR